ncbi:MAG TPA: hypothetical protein DCY88_19535 [Cyanobacteria bacterium UBA11372]|nr:hypothetical protein [Cyanobacteria bacterium UBA11372]
MLPKQLSKNSSKSVLNTESLQQLVIELNEQNQATISGGYAFPCDGPGRGGTCGGGSWDHPIYFSSR